MDINFELYKVFYYVAKDLSFSAAANKLFISQSAVSQSIKTLEDRMNCSLFFRNTKKVKLTYEGEVLFKYIEQAFNFIKTGEHSIFEINSLDQGEIRIGVTDTICKYYLIPYIKKFTLDYPNIKIHIVNRTSPECVDLLRSGSVDFSIINLPVKKDQEVIDTKILRPVDDTFIANNRFKELSGRKVSLEELKNYSILMLEKNTITRKFFDDFMGSYNIDITPEIELGSIDLLVELAKIGLGISFVMRDCAKLDIDNGNLFVIDLEEVIPKRDLGLITHKNIPLSTAAKEFIKMLK
jgi:DNA-binding transcriptional LysR family regulator